MLFFTLNQKNTLVYAGSYEQIEWEDWAKWFFLSTNYSSLRIKTVKIVKTMEEKQFFACLKSFRELLQHISNALNDTNILNGKTKNLTNSH